MYNPEHFREDRVDVMHELIRRHSLAALVTFGSGGLDANHIPMLLDPEPAPYGTLRGHVARANPVWREESAKSGALAIFMGPETYISPSWYATKAETGKVVPTWNYVVVHAHGPLEFFEDVERLRQIVTTLTTVNEAAFEQPWAVEDAPADYIDSLLKAIVGIEMRISRLEGKWKTSQNRPPADRERVAEALADSAMADLVRRR